MSATSDSKPTADDKAAHRRPAPGERNRGGVDALQTKVAVNLQNLDSDCI